MGEQTIVVATDEESFNEWVVIMKSNKNYLTPQWLVDNVKSHCSVIGYK